MPGHAILKAQGAMPSPPRHPPNQRLRLARARHGWSQEELAARLDTTALAVYRWETGRTFPSPYYRQKLSTLFAMSMAALGLLPPHPAVITTPPDANPPGSTTRFFPVSSPQRLIGREDMVNDLRTRLLASPRARGIALCGLPGVGKTPPRSKSMSAGLTTSRRLIDLEIATDQLPPGDATSPMPMSVAALLPAVLQQEQPDWEYELPAILSLPSQGVAMTHADGTTSGLIYRHTNESAYILAADLAPSLTRDTFVALLHAIAGTKSKIYLFNEPAATRLYHLCEAIGFTEYFSQYEMMLAL